MVKYNVFSDPLRQEEIEKFYTVCQLHRNYYREYPRAFNPLTYFKDSTYLWQCPAEMSQVYLSFPPAHVKYKQPALLPLTLARTSVMPTLPDRTLAGRYKKDACKAFVR